MLLGTCYSGQVTGTHYTLGRVGAMITPYIAQVLLKKSLTGAISVYGIMGKKIK